MSSNEHLLDIKSFCVCSDDEEVEQADNETSFDDAYALLESLREKNPDQTWVLVAEIDA